MSILTKTTKTLKQNFRKLTTNKNTRLPLFLALFATIGVIALLATKAATPFASIEPESGTLAGAACPVSPAGASGSAVQFGVCSTGGGALNLPRIPWDGGPNYWKKFAKADAAGWDDPSFFPIGVHYGKPSLAGEEASAGINLYQGVERDCAPPTGTNTCATTMLNITNSGIFALPDLSWQRGEVGDNPKVPGWFICDEPDMGSCDGSDATNEQQSLDAMKREVDRAKSYNDGRFTNVNFANGVLRSFWMNTLFAQMMRYPDSSSVDKYSYTSPHVQDLFRNNAPNWPAGANPRTAASYGWQSDQMISFMDPNNLEPAWIFVEAARPYLIEDGARTITGNEIEGAVWSSIIHEARGIVYFEHSNAPECDAQHSIVDCPNLNRAKITQVNAKVKSLAPIINTQSYVYDFNNQTDTMLKTYNGSAYIFAGIGILENPGSKTFTLPAGINGTTVTVEGENRTIPVNANRQFTDNFAAEYSHHVYKIAL